MVDYDVVIVGAGPAGGQCARELTLNGKHVLLAEKACNFSTNNYSSGGAPLEIMEKYGIPNDTVGTFWDKLSIHSPSSQHTWTSSTPKGVILDFAKLRQFLANETEKFGGVVKLGTFYKSHKMDGEILHVELKGRNGQADETVKTRVLVDATGTERAVLTPPDYPNKRVLAVTGLEHLVEVSEEVYKHYASTLSFFLGSRWMPQGYAWVFPMERPQLKIGLIRYFPHNTFVPHERSYGTQLKQLISNILKDTPYKLLDKHGKTLHYSLSRRDPHYDGNIIAIGDAISMLNPLASEGIRHALESGRSAAYHISRYLDTYTPDFDEYVQDMKEYCGMKWWMSEQIMKRAYREPDDEKVDLMLHNFKRFSFDEMMDLAFGYDLKIGFRYYIGRIVDHFCLAMRRLFKMNSV